MADIEKIKKLRTLTGAGFKDCSSALAEAKGDIDTKANSGSCRWSSAFDERDQDYSGQFKGNA